MKAKFILVQIEATVRHCNNNCVGMTFDAGYCRIFATDLEWDKNKTVNGNKRLKECLQAERDEAARSK